MKINYKKLEQDSKSLAQKIEKGKYDAVYGIPAGGILPAFIISKELDIPLVSEIEEGKNILVVDDLVDSGDTILSLREEYGNFDVAVIYIKDVDGIGASLVEVYEKLIPNEWVDLPHEGLELPIENNIIRILEYYNQQITVEEVSSLNNLIKQRYEKTK